jgi:hypothetical protein
MAETVSIYKMPQIKRARDYHLYDTKGRRYLDFYQEGGKALLGHKPDRLSVRLKNMVGKGLYASYPGIYESRLQNALTKLLPEYRKIRIFGDFADALDYLSKITGRNVSKKDIAEPVFEAVHGVNWGSKSKEGGAISWWRPFLMEKFPDIILPILPLPGLSYPVIVAEKSRKEEFLSQPVSALVLDALCRVVHNLIGFQAGVWPESWKTEAFPIKQFLKNGPYLYFGGTEEEYREVCKAGLETGVVFAPFHPSISIIPAKFDAGELRAFHKKYPIKYEGEQNA